MSTIFAGLFMVILILMGFNLMLWNFIQLDAYNTVTSSMNQRDRQAISENLVPVNPGVISVTSSSFGINVTNLGGTSVTIVRVYITNESIAGSSLTSCKPCIIDPAPSNPYSFTNGNIAVGETNHIISVTGVNICGFGAVCQTSVSYKFILASSRGRLYTFSYPWRATNVVVVNQNGLFQTNIGPLSIFFDFNSFNFTSAGKDCTTSPTDVCPHGSQSKPAWILPSSANIILWIKVTNNSPKDVTLQVQSAINFARYSSQGTSGATTFFIVGSASSCAGGGGGVCTIQPYTTPITLPGAGPQGPGQPTIVLFSATTQGGGLPNGTPAQTGPYLLSIGFFYVILGGFQGETVPFVGADVCPLANYQTSTPC